MAASNITLTIDGRQITVEPGTTILKAAEKLGIRIPTLCYHPDLSYTGNCRVCLVEVKEMGFFMAACSVKVWEGMEVCTHSAEIRRARRDVVELLLDNHSKDCQTCERDGNCELQNLAYSLGVRERLFEGKRKDFPVDASSRSVVREPKKCILCERCVRVCAEIQGVHNLSQQGRGFETIVTPAHGHNMDESVCIQCGQCIAVCPTAAFLEQNHTEEVWAALSAPNKHVVVQTAPSIRATIAEGFGRPAGTPDTGRMVAALRMLGFDGVFDTDFGADLTIVEESNEFLERLKNGGTMPMLTSCSPGWITYLEKFYPQLIPHASSARSPMTMTSVLLKTYYAEKKGIAPEDVYVVAVMPCVAKKYEARRPEHYLNENIPYTDAVLTTRELIWMIKSAGIDLWTLQGGLVDLFPEEGFDDPMGISSGAGDIFGTTGGVMEATLRTAAAKLGGPSNSKLEFTEVRAVEGLRESVVKIGDLELNVGVANGITNASKLLNKVVRGEKQFHIIEIMACPGGCIGGGGQPYPPKGVKPLDPELLQARAGALYRIDGSKELRLSHENPAIIKLYEDYLGQPGSEKAHQLLHTTYSAKLPRGIA